MAAARTRPPSPPARGCGYGGWARARARAARAARAPWRPGPEAARCAEAAGLPLLAEPSAGARSGANAIGPYQRMLPALAGEVAQVIVYGRPTLSRPVSGLLANAEHVTVVADHPEWVDVSGRAEQIVAGVDAAGSADPRWLVRWRDWEREVAQEEAARAGLAARGLAHALGYGQIQTMIGSSMAIRHADIHGPVGEAYTRAPVYSARSEERRVGEAGRRGRWAGWY